MPARHPLQDIKDAVCLDAYLDGWSAKELSAKCQVSVQTIWRWIARARENPNPPHLELWMNGAGKACIHHKPILRGMPVLCLDCDPDAKGNRGDTGLPNHPALRSVKKRIYEESQTVAEEVQKKGIPKFKPRIKSQKTRKA